MKIFDYLKKILFSPIKFFSTLKEKSIGPAVLWFAIFSLVGIILGFSMVLVFPSLYGEDFSKFPLPLSPIVFFVLTGIVTWIFSIIGSFIGAGILHVYLWLFGARQGYTKTYQLMSYSATPAFLFSWIPFLKYPVALWRTILMVIGTHKLHKLSLVRSIVAYVVAFLIMVSLVLLLFLFLYLILKSQPGAFEMFMTGFKNALAEQSLR